MTCGLRKAGRRNTPPAAGPQDSSEGLAAKKKKPRRYVLPRSSDVFLVLVSLSFPPPVSMVTASVQTVVLPRRNATFGDLDTPDAV